MVVLDEHRTSKVCLWWSIINIPQVRCVCWSMMNIEQVISVYGGLC